MQRKKQIAYFVALGLLFAAVSGVPAIFIVLNPTPQAYIGFFLMALIAVGLFATAGIYLFRVVREKKILEAGKSGIATVIGTGAYGDQPPYNDCFRIVYQFDCPGRGKRIGKTAYIYSRKEAEYLAEAVGSIEIKFSESGVSAALPLSDKTKCLAAEYISLDEYEEVERDDEGFHDSVDGFAVKDCESDHNTDENGFEIVDGNLLYYDGNDELVVIPSNVTMIEENAFRDSPFLKTVIIPFGVVAIDDAAFSNCTNLETVELSESIEDIWKYAFSGCGKLKSLDMSKLSGLMHIVPYTFMNCNELSSVMLAPDLKSIATGAFQNCTKIAELIIPASVTKVAESAFFGWTSEQTIVVNGTNFRLWHKKWMNHCDANIVYS